MAPLLFKEMKGVKLSCATSSSTAICTSITDHRSIVHPGNRGAQDHNRTLHQLLDPKTPRHQASPASQTSVKHKPKQKTWKSLNKTNDPFSPSVSSRYLLTKDFAFSHVLPDTEFDPRATVGDEQVASRPSASNEPKDQVVVLWVSLHCKGCEGKVRRHLKKMEGVKSFDIDLATKKVTVIGDKTPLDVLNSVSKVKNAQLWPSSTS